MKRTNKSVNGTSFHSTTIDASVSTLRGILGDPAYCENNGTDKVNFEWEMETDEGDVFTVYDWKEYRPISENEIIRWHIGGHSVLPTLKAKNEIIEAINILNGEIHPAFKNDKNNS